MDDSPALDALVGAARAPLGEWPERYPDYEAMGTMCSYVPEEIIHAAGFTPVRIRGTAEPLKRVDAHLQSFTCALCRSTLDQALGDKLGFLAGTVFAHTCDAMQALSDLWRMHNEASHFVDTVMQPANLGTPAARRYLKAELERFRENLASFSGRPMDDGDLHSSINLYDESRDLIRALQALRGRISSARFFAVLDAGQRMPRERFNPLLSELVAALETAPSHATDPGLFLSGAVLDEVRVLELMDDLGARVVGDDLCSGSRHFRDRVGSGDDPMGSLADYYLRRPPCPTKYHPTHQAGEYLLDLVRHDGADGVVFVLEKFCEPHAFDYALILPVLDAAGVPHLLLEMEQTPSIEALRTRLQAFVEML
jgi:bzd-type benzoyl-CoA reductase N subunit